jgi:hypothetical protein
MTHLDVVADLVVVVAPGVVVAGAFVVVVEPPVSKLLNIFLCP